MSRLPSEFIEDRALRDAARDVLLADIEHARATFSGAGVAGRVAGRIGGGAKDVIEVAKVHADDNRGILAGLIALLALWFAREPLLEIFGLAPAEETSTDQPSAAEPPLDEDQGPSEGPGAQEIEEVEAPQERELADLEPVTTGDTP